MGAKRKIYVEAAAAAGVALLLLGLTLAMTHPLAQYFGQGIPYQRNPIAGYQVFPLVTGDHLQFYYWLWVFSDNVLGPSALFTNPYEFNTFLSQGVANYANFPWSVFFLAFLGLGPVKAYNLQLVLSYVLAGLCSYGLARQVLGSRWAALPAAVAVTFLPLRQALVLGGHLYGFVIFLFPLMLMCLERGWDRGSWRWGAAAGLSLVAMGLMEPHLTYYSALFLGLYIPLRLVLLAPDRDDTSGRPVQAAAPLAAGLGLGTAAHLALVRRGAAELWSWGWLEGIVIYGLLALGAWLLLAALLQRLSDLTRARARTVVGRAMLPLAGTAVYGLQLVTGLPHLGTAILALAGLASLVVLGLGLRRTRWRWSWPRGALAPVWPTLAGLALAAAKMLHLKATTFDPSAAAAGRGLPEVKAFSPRLADLFAASNDVLVNLIYPGAVLAALALAGLVMLCLARPAGSRGRSRAALWSLAGLVAVLLAVGPSVEVAPLYQVLFKYVPFFNFPRMTGRWMMLAVLMLALVGGWGLRELLRRWPDRRWLAGLLCLAVAGAMAWDYRPRGPVGICLLPPPGPVEAAVRRELPPGPKVTRRLLGLPLWPGDSHQSSRYEYTITQTRAPMVNGYSPVAPAAYVDQVFWPLYPLDQGEVSASALRTLRKLRVGLVSFHDDPQVFSRKVSPFPPSLARRRLEASGLLVPVAQQGKVFLYRLAADARPDPDPGRVTSPVTSLWEAAWLRPRTGRLVEDRRASGWGLLFADSGDPAHRLGRRIAGAAGNVAQAKAGRDRPGWLAAGTGKYFPAGRYLARFRLRRGPGPDPGRVEVARGKSDAVLASRRLAPAVLPADGRWHDVALEFDLATVGPINLRVWFNGKADLELDVVLVNFAGRIGPEPFYRAQDLWRQVGGLVRDSRVPGGLAVTARAGYTPPIYIMHGPQVTLAPGDYRARFRLAGRPGPAGSTAPAAYLEVATDLGRLPLGHRRVTAGQLGSEYREFAVDFTIKRRCEVGLRVRFLGGAHLRLAGVGLQRR